MIRVVLTAIVVLSGGVTKWFMPSQLRTGETVRCAVGAKHVDVKVAAPPGSGTAFGWDWTKGGVKLSISRNANGASQVTCGDVKLPALRGSTTPYLIGPNGLNLIRGANTLAKLEANYGKPNEIQFGSACAATWKAIGLQVRFAGAACTASSVLVSATATGRRWSSLDGVHVGDSLARMVFEARGARKVDGRWRVSAGLDALIARGIVTGFEIVPR
jgi:hypothetical protein